MTQEFINQQKLVLLAALDRLKSITHRTTLQDPSETACSDFGDISAAAIAAESALTLMSNSTTIRWEIGLALDKIEKGTYGLCELSGAPIGTERLEAIPWARFSIQAQLDLEKGKPVGHHGHHGPLFDDASETVTETEDGQEQQEE